QTDPAAAREALVTGRVFDDSVKGDVLTHDDLSHFGPPSLRGEQERQAQAHPGPGTCRCARRDTATAANGPADSFCRRPVSVGVMRMRRKPSDRPAVLSNAALSRARAGDENAFRELVDPYRRELQLHCYRILGSLQDAEDQVQETLLAAWRGLDGFEERASFRAWLYRIATNRCLNALRDRRRRPQEVPSMVEPPEPTRRVEPVWLDPYPDVLLEGLTDAAQGPEARYETREADG